MRFTILFLLAASLLNAGEIRPAGDALDGGKGGHWGTKNDANWVDGRWNAMDAGPFMSCTLPFDGATILKNITVKVGAPGEGAVSFDTAACGLRGGWTKGFLAFSPKRFGVIEHPRPNGTVAFSAPTDALWNSPATYDGLTRHQNAIVFHYRVGNTTVSETTALLRAGETPVFVRRFSLGAHADELTLRLAHLPGATPTKASGLNLLAGTQGSRALSIGVSESTSAALVIDKDAAMLKFAPAQTPTSVTVFYATSTDPAWIAQGTALLAQLPEIAAISKPGARLWADEPAAKGVIAPNDKGLVVDEIPLPLKNSAKALLFLTGLDFLPNGDAAVCTLHGDVWIVRGLDEGLESVRWSRYASGLFQPLGLKVVNGAIYVLGRDQITRLEDANNDGEADVYHAFYRNESVSPGNHDYAACLETDSAGRFYFVCPKGLHRVSADGKSHEIVATGWRNPITLSIGPGDVPTVSPQEGEWTPSSMIFTVKPNGYYGYGGPKVSPERPLGYDAPLCWLPRLVDNSTGGQVWVPENSWGALKNQLINLSFGRSAMQLVYPEANGNAAIVPLPYRFPSGACRGRFNPRDGQLYVVGTMGWASNANLDGCLQRVRRTDKALGFPVSVKTYSNGVLLNFDAPLDKADAEDAGAYLVEAWQYKYSAKYGSNEFALSQPDQKGRDEWTVKSARLSADGRGLFLEIAEFQPAMQIQIKYKLKQADGARLNNDVVLTVHKLPAESFK